MSDHATPRVALATYRALPRLDDDGQRILTGLRARGVHADPTVWDDPSVRWDGFDLVLLRSVWDYHHRWHEFARWLTQIPLLINSRTVVEWNADKQYLRELDRVGIPVVPTSFVAPGAAADLGLPGDIVVKPAMSASAHDTFRCDSASSAAAAIGRITATGRTALVQPYLTAVDTLGELSLVFLGGRFSHAFRRAPRLTPDRDRPLPNRTEPANASPGELDLGYRTLQAAPESVSYARVDLLPDSAGDPVVSELELIEPGLRLDLAPAEAVDHLVDVVERRTREVAVSSR